MDADLSRLLARAKDSPVWRSLYGISSTPASKQLLEKLTKESVAAYTFDKLPENTRKFLSDCDRSIAIGTQVFGDRLPNPMTNEDRRKLAEAMSKSHAAN